MLLQLDLETRPSTVMTNKELGETLCFWNHALYFYIAISCIYPRIPRYLKLYT